MDSWPVDYRTDVTPLGRGGRRIKQESPHNYPDIKLGSLNAVTLFEKDNRLEWTSVLENTVPGHFMRFTQVVIRPWIVATVQAPSPYHNHLSSNAFFASLHTTKDYIETRRARGKPYVSINKTRLLNTHSLGQLPSHLPSRHRRTR